MKKNEKLELLSDIQCNVSDSLCEIFCTCCGIEHDLSHGKVPSKEELQKDVTDIKSVCASIRNYLSDLFHKEDENNIPEVSGKEVYMFLEDISKREDKRIQLMRFWAELCIEYDLDLDDFEIWDTAHSYLLFKKTGKYIY